MNTWDAIVIGAGSVGAPITYFLAKEGLKVLCLDRLSSEGQGQNKAAIGGVRATHSDPAKINICQESLKIFSTWEEKTGYDIGWKKGGYCFPVFGEREEGILKSILPIQKKFKLNIDWVGAEQVMELIPGVNPKGLLGGTYSPDDGQISPLLAVSGFVREARRLGAEFRFNTTVSRIMVKRGQVEGVRVGMDKYHSPIIVNAAGARATALGKTIGVDIPVVPDSHEAGITSPIRQFLQPLVVDLRPGKNGRTANFYFGQMKTGQIIFCYTPIKPIVGKDRRCTSQFMPTIAARLSELLPRFRNLMIRRLWRGLYPMTPDGVPVVGGWKEIKGYYMAVGMCGQGFMMGPGTAINLAHLITRGEPLLDKKTFSMLSPRRDFYRKRKELLK